MLVGRITANLGSFRVDVSFVGCVVSSFSRINLSGSSAMSKKRHRSRSRSRSSTKHGRRSELEQSPPPSPHKRQRSSNEEQDSLSAILKTLQEVQQDLKHTIDRVSLMEKHWHLNIPVFLPNSSVETDSLTVMIHSDEDLVSNSEGLDMASKPPVRANEPPTEVSEPQKQG